MLRVLKKKKLTLSFNFALKQPFNNILLLVLCMFINKNKQLMTKTIKELKTKIKALKIKTTKGLKTKTIKGLKTGAMKGQDQYNQKIEGKDKHMIEDQAIKGLKVKTNT